MKSLLILIKNFLASLALIGLFSGLAACQPKESNSTDKLLATLLLQALTQKEYYSRLYKIIPDTTGVGGYELTEVTASNASSLVSPTKPKLVIVHGWLMEDRNLSLLPAPSELKKRITDQGFWGFFMGTTEFTSIISHYDVYAYDYHSGYGVDENGTLLRQRLDTAFGSANSGTVVLYAHSMGGLVTRFALYTGDSAPPYLNKILSTGSPYHGSPWASPQWQADMTSSITLGETMANLTAFMTETQGGKDLRWDNFDGSIVGAENAKLTEINARTDRDHYVTAWYGGCDMDPKKYEADSNYKACNGSYNAGIDGSEGLTGSIHTLQISCSEILRVVSGANYSWSTFNTADCVVPDKSAIKQTAGLDPLNLSAADTTYAATEGLGGQDHFDMKMQAEPVRKKFLNFLGVL